MALNAKHLPCTMQNLIKRSVNQAQRHVSLTNNEQVQVPLVGCPQKNDSFMLQTEKRHNTQQLD